MNDQDSMTREQLEAAGYCFSFPEDTFPNDLVFPLQWGHSEHAYVLVWSEEEAYNIATAHYRQQQELARLREAMAKLHRELEDMRSTLKDRDLSEHQKIYDLGYSWTHAMHIVERATVSKTEQPE